MAKMTNKMLARIHELRAQGVSIRCMSRWLKVSRQTIYYHIDPEFRLKAKMTRLRYPDYRIKNKMIEEYIKSFDHVRGAWKKKQEAASFGDFLAHELELNRKGVVVENDGRSYRIHLPLLQTYWHPSEGGWTAHLNALKRAKKAIWTD